MRADVDYVVTEFGIAKLKGRTLRERAFALLDIADPRFRDADRRRPQGAQGRGLAARATSRAAKKV